MKEGLAQDDTTTVIPRERSESRNPLKPETAADQHSPEKSGGPSTRPPGGLAQDDRQECHPEGASNASELRDLWGGMAVRYSLGS